MKTHPTALNEIKSYEDLGRQIVGLRYDLLQKVLVGMRDEAMRQSAEDERKERVKLAFRLEQLGGGLQMALEAAGEVAHICAPYIQAEKTYLQSIGEPRYIIRQITIKLDSNG